MTDPTDEPIPPDPMDYARQLWNEWRDLPMPTLPGKPGDDPEVDERMVRALKETAVASDNPNAYDALVTVAAWFLRDPLGRQMMPIWLSRFAADVIEGKRTRPTRRGPDPYPNWVRDFKLAHLTPVIARRYKLPLFTHNELSRKWTAAEVVSEAADVPTETVINALRRFPQS